MTQTVSLCRDGPYICLLRSILRHLVFQVHRGAISQLATEVAHFDQLLPVLQILDLLLFEHVLESLELLDDEVERVVLTREHHLFVTEAQRLLLLTLLQVVALNEAPVGYDNGGSSGPL